jgi:hypothetical protein
MRIFSFGRNSPDAGTTEYESTADGPGVPIQRVRP